MVWWAPLAAAAGGAILGKALEPSMRSGAEGIYRDIAAGVDKIEVPTPEEQFIQIESLVQQGLITPIEAEEILADPSLMAEITTDPMIKEAQTKSLIKLEELAEGGGYSLEDQARLSTIQREVGAQERGGRERISQEMAERGIRGSGLELAQQLMLNQAASEKRSQEGLARAAQGEQRALDALMQSGQMAGQMRSQEFGEESAKASAQDAIDQFNIANQRQTQSQNIQMQMQSQAQNLAEKQRIAEANAQRRQEEQLRRAQLKQQQYQNTLDKERIKANAMGGAADAMDKTAGRKGKLYGGLIGAAGQIGASYLKKS